MARVFVYGSLLSGEANHGVVARARRIGEARTTPTWSLVSLGAWPALVPGGVTAVSGEVYEASDDELAALDRFEEVPELFTRESIDLDDGTRAFAYVMPRANGEPIPSGDWRAFRRGARR